MRKVILVTSSASSTILQKYLDYEIVGLDEGIEVARQTGAKISLAISTFETISLQYILTFLPKDKIVKYTVDSDTPYLKIINYLFSQGVEEIVLLASLSGSLDYIHGLLLTIKNAKGSVSIQNENNLITYYSKGSHVIMKQDFTSLYLIGFPVAVVSMEHVGKPLKNQKLDFSADKAISNSILERVAILKVNEGGVLLVLTKND